MNEVALVEENARLKACLAETEAALAEALEARGRLESIVAELCRERLLTRKNALFAGHEVGAENWAMLASLIATCKLTNVNPLDYIAETLRALLDGHPRSRIEEPMPWAFRKASSRAA